MCHILVVWISVYRFFCSRLWFLFLHISKLVNVYVKLRIWFTLNREVLFLMAFLLPFSTLNNPLLLEYVTFTKPANLRVDKSFVFFLFVFFFFFTNLTYLTYWYFNKVVYRYFQVREGNFLFWWAVFF